MSKNSLDNIDAKLSEMLTNSTRVFDISMNALLGDTNLDSVRDDLYDTDKAINELHREVRREMIIHSAVNSRNLDIPLLLSYMTMSKDIERIGDYCKYLFEIAETGNTFAKGDDLDSYIELRNDIGKLIVYLQSCIALDDESKVSKLKKSLLGIFKKPEFEHNIKEISVDSGHNINSNGTAKIKVRFKADQKPEMVSRLIDSYISSMDEPDVKNIEK